MVFGDILQLTAFTSFAGQIGMNVFHYQVLVTQVETAYQYVTAAWASDKWAMIAAHLSSQVVLTSLEVRNLTNGVDIYSAAFNVAGSVSGDALPPFVAYAFRLNRTNALTRHGQKRFWGVPESLQANGAPIASELPYLQQIGEDLGGNLVEESQGNHNFELATVIVGRVLNAEGQYELALNRLNPVLSSQFVRISSQNTRKIGRGI
jgi:hypothetical protein